jgi:hypothetical protein
VTIFVNILKKSFGDHPGHDEQAIPPFSLLYTQKHNVQKYSCRQENCFFFVDSSRKFLQVKGNTKKLLSSQTLSVWSPEKKVEAFQFLHQVCFYFYYLSEKTKRQKNVFA